MIAKLLNRNVIYFFGYIHTNLLIWDSFIFFFRKKDGVIILKAGRGNKLTVSPLDTGKINLSSRTPDQRPFAPSGLVHHTVKIRGIYRTLICLVIA